MKKFLSVLSGESFDIPPVWLMRQAGRYLPEYRELRVKAGGFLNLVYNPEWAAEVTLQPVRRFGFDAAILFSDILIVPHALGADLRFGEGEGPQFTPIRTLLDIENLQAEKTVEKFSLIFETVRRTKAGLDESTALIGFAGAPWTVAAYMLEGHGSRDFAVAKQVVYQNPQLMQKLLDLLVDATIEYLAGQIEAGAEVIQLFDSWAGILNETDFESWVIQPTKKLVAKFRARYPHIPVIGFPRGATFAAAHYVKETGVTAIQLDTVFHVTETQKFNVPVQGWLDPALLLAGGKALENGILHIKSAMRGRPFIFNLGHGIIKETPIENVELLIKTIREQ